MSRVPNSLVVNPKIAARTVPEFIDYARANPGKITAATQGNGTTSHLTAELFALMGRARFQNVPYRGSAPALTDLVAGNVDIMFDNLGVSLALVKSGQLKSRSPPGGWHAAGGGDCRNAAGTWRVVCGGGATRPRHRRQAQRRHTKRCAIHHAGALAASPRRRWAAPGRDRHLHA